MIDLNSQQDSSVTIIHLNARLTKHLWTVILWRLETIDPNTQSNLTEYWLQSTQYDIYAISLHSSNTICDIAEILAFSLIWNIWGKRWMLLIFIYYCTGLLFGILVLLDFHFCIDVLNIIHCRWGDVRVPLQCKPKIYFKLFSDFHFLDFSKNFG